MPRAVNTGKPARAPRTTRPARAAKPEATVEAATSAEPEAAAEATTSPKRAATSKPAASTRASTKAEAPKTVRIQLVKSPIGYTERQKATVRALGLRRMQQIVERPDSPSIRGMVTAIGQLVRVIEP